jgi:hypothetical protein
MKTLEATCGEMRADILADFDLGPGDAKDLFERIWQHMVRDAQGGALNTAIDLVTDHFGIE